MRCVFAGVRAREASRGSRRVGQVLFLAFVASVGLFAQAPAAGGKVYTLDQAISYALANYPAVRASLERVNAAQSGIRLARTQYLPSLTGAYQDSRATQNQVPGIWLPTPVTPTVEGPIGGSSGQSFWGSQVAALFSWEPIDFGLRPAMVTRARSAADKSNADLALTRLQVAGSAGDYFLMALASQQAALAAQANVDRWQVFDQSIHDLVSSELRPGADGSRADAQLALAKTQLYRVQQAEQATLATLAALMGTAGSEIRLESGPLLGLPPSGALPNAAPLTDHPLARDEMAEVREIQAQEKILDRTDYPRIYVQAEGFGRGSDIPNNGSIIGTADGLEPARGNWVAGITISFPNVFDFKALGWQKQISKANERSQQAEYDKTIQDLTGQVQAAVAELKTAQLVAEQTTIELDAARASEAQSRARYDASLTTVVDVAEAENLLAQAEMDDAVARLNVWRGLFDVAYTQGDLQPFLDLLRAAH